MFKWILYFPLAIFFKLLGYFLAPVLALLVVKEEREDKVKRLDKFIVTMSREYLPKWCRWFQTHDNAVDEYFWGFFSKKGDYLHDITIEEYQSSRWARYYFRLRWLLRNTSYGILYNLLGSKYEETPVHVTEVGEEDSGSFWFRMEFYNTYFHLEAQLPILNTSKYRSINIGWKHHKGFPRVMYALRAGFGKKDY